jgi:hypothetical protein
MTSSILAQAVLTAHQVVLQHHLSAQTVQQATSVHLEATAPMSAQMVITVLVALKTTRTTPAPVGLTQEYED